VWEVVAWDAHGKYGQLPQPSARSVSFSSLLGINGIWAWGGQGWSMAAADGWGPRRYNGFASHGRNYHNWHWDVRDPDTPPRFEDMSLGQGTDAQWWLDWDWEYGGWQAAGLEVQASIQFTSDQFARSSFDTPYTAAYNYGFEFASHFGPTSGTGNVNAMEVGNEPWMSGHGYPDAEFYNEILLGMARGAKAGDPAVRVYPAVFTPQDTFARMNLTHMEYLDGLNTHAYSWIGTAAGRTATYPEHPSSSLRASLFLVKYRDEFFPLLDVYLSELGWDSAGAQQSCDFSECVSEHSQALYAIRGALFVSRLGFDRLSWFFYANLENVNHNVFSRSGLTGSAAVGFAPKQALKALEVFVSTLGSRRFLGVLREDDQAYVYTLGDEHGTPSHVVAWRPIDGDNRSTTTISIAILHAPQRAWVLGGWEYAEAPLPTVAAGGAAWVMQISSMPVAVSIESLRLGCAAGCPAGTICVDGACVCAAQAGQVNASRCSEQEYCLANEDCLSGKCQRFRGSGVLKVCTANAQDIVVNATLQITGISAETFSSENKAAFADAVARLSPSINVSDLVISEVVTAVAIPSVGRRSLQSDPLQVSGIASTVQNAATIHFQILHTPSVGAAASVTTALSQGVASGTLASTLTSAGIGSDPTSNYAVQTSLQSVAVSSVNLDCHGTIAGPAVTDPCGVCHGDGSTCLDCAAVPNGGSSIDICGVCGGSNASCVQNTSHPSCQFRYLIGNLTSVRNNASSNSTFHLQHDMLSYCRARLLSSTGLTRPIHVRATCNDTLTCDIRALLAQATNVTIIEQCTRVLLAMDAMSCT
jgi:hypothetical protein